MQKITWFTPMNHLQGLCSWCDQDCNDKNPQNHCWRITWCKQHNWDAVIHTKRSLQNYFAGAWWISAGSWSPFSKGCCNASSNKHGGCCFTFSSSTHQIEDWKNLGNTGAFCIVRLNILTSRNKLFEGVLLVFAGYQAHRYWCLILETASKNYKAKKNQPATQINVSKVWNISSLSCLWHR